MRRRAAAVVIACVVWAIVPPAAAPHSVLERSAPAAATTVATAPAYVDLWFSEPVDPNLSVVRVLDAGGRRVSGLSAPSVDGRRLTVSVGTLLPGVYTVRWRVLSTLDGHTTGGAFVFGVGESDTLTGAGSGESSAGDWPPIALLLSRWAALIAGLVGVAATWFHPLVVTPALRRADVADATLIDDAATRITGALRVGAGLTLAVITPVEAAVRTFYLLDAPLGGALAGGHIWTFVLGTRQGWSLLARWWLALLLALPGTQRGMIFQATGLGWFVIVTSVTAGFGGPGILAGSAHLSILILVAAVYAMISLLATMILPLIPDVRIPRMPAIPMTAAALIPAVGTLNTHAWTGGPIAVVADFMHAFTAALWVGGSLCLLSILWWAPPDRRAHVLRALAPRVGRVASVSVAVLFATGLVASLLNVSTFSALWSTAYGLGVIAKALIFGCMLAIGAWFWRQLNPSRADGRPVALPAWLRGLAGDAGLGALALLAAAAITLLPPANVVVQQRAATRERPDRPGDPGLVLGAEAPDLRVRLEIRPARPGVNRVAARVMGATGLPIDSQARVMVRLTNLDEDLSPVTITLTPTPAAGYEASTGALAVPGLWQADVVVRRVGQEDAVAFLPMVIGARSVRSNDPAALALLRDSERAFDAVKAWRQEQQVTDSTGGIVSVRSEFVRPDRLRARTRSAEVVIVGRAQVRRGADGTVQRTMLPTALTVAFPYLSADAARNVALGRTGLCEREPCRVVSWESAGGTATYAAWVGLRTKLPHQVFMITSSRHTTVRVDGINAPIRIELP